TGAVLPAGLPAEGQGRVSNLPPAPTGTDGLNGTRAGAADGTAPAPRSEASNERGPRHIGAFVVGAAGVLVVVGATGYVLLRRGRRRHAEEQRAALRRLRAVAEEDLKAFAAELDRLDFRAAQPGVDDAMRADHERALDAYDKAGQDLAGARRPGDIRLVTQSIEDGRFSLTQLDARRAGRPLPERRPPCFFDPRHGPSARDARWTPPGRDGTGRLVPVCAQDAALLEGGGEPVVRVVDAGAGERRPYYAAGPAYAPWVEGYWGPSGPFRAPRRQGGP
ncbi:hypothetical protein OFY01_08845, partial [Streptomyces sp. GXMU-J5]|nr:hypothetical protein [Streptomyces beihaiensis]